MREIVYHCIDCREPFGPREFIRAMGAFYRRGPDDTGRCAGCEKIHRAEKAERDLAEGAARQAAIAPKRRMWRQTCGIPSLFMDKDFETFDRKRQPNAYKMATEYAEAFPVGQPWGAQSLVMYSETRGLGKTHLACSIIHALLDRWEGEDIKRPVYFMTEPDLLMSIQATFSQSREEQATRESESDILGRLSAEPLLVLDDVGQVERRDMRFVQEKLFSLIDSRYRRRLPMVITSNLDTGGMERYLGPATFDRICEMTQRKFTHLEGSSYRRQAR